MHLKNLGFTYKSQIIKFKKQQKVLNKKDTNWYIYMFKIFFIPTKNHF